MIKILTFFLIFLSAINVNGQEKIKLDANFVKPFSFNDFKIQLFFKDIENDSILFPKNYCVDNTSTPFLDVDIVQMLYGVNNRNFLIEDIASMADIDCFIIEENRKYDTICRFNSKGYKINLLLFAMIPEKTENYVLMHYAKVKTINGIELIIASNPIYFTVRKNGEKFNVKEIKCKKRKCLLFPTIKW